jgi:predicted 3-demethylubiquinone-9 3-methyltransferase (glyoxalase superfamily)
MITPFLWFDGQAEEAVNFYISIFKNSKIDKITHYGDAGPGETGSVMSIEFQLEGQDFMALNGGPTGTDPVYGPFQGAIALFVDCETQADVDALWNKLSEGGKKAQCGWLTDRYGFTWNIVPAGLGDVLRGDDPEGSERAFKAMLQMEKLDIDELRRAYEGVPT